MKHGSMLRMEMHIYYNERVFGMAMPLMNTFKLLVYNNSNPELNYKTGVSALFSDNKEEGSTDFY